MLSLDVKSSVFAGETTESIAPVYEVWARAPKNVYSAAPPPNDISSVFRVRRDAGLAFMNDLAGVEVSSRIDAFEERALDMHTGW